LQQQLQQQNPMLVKPTPNPKVAIIVPHMPWSFASTVPIWIDPPADTANWGA